MKLHLSVILWLAFPIQMFAVDYYVSVIGNDNASGSQKEPFQTIRKAANSMQPGDTCYIKGGHYREELIVHRSGSEGKPITYKAFQNEKVIIDGRDPLEVKNWKLLQKGIWQASVDEKFHRLLTNNDAQLFIDDAPMIEARWPNMKYHENWDDSKKWAEMDMNARAYGTIKSSAVAESGIDFSGGTLHFKYVKNFFGSCKITRHSEGSDTISYEKTAGWGDPENTKIALGAGGHCPEFYIGGCLSVLDAEEEWFYDNQKRVLYIVPPQARDPQNLNISIKARTFGIKGEEISYVNFEGLTLLGCSLKLGREALEWPTEDPKKKATAAYKCKMILCKILYPIEERWAPITESRDIFVFDAGNKINENYPKINGDSCEVTSCEFGWVHYCFSFEGRGNILKNCVVHDTSLNGKMNRSGIQSSYGYKADYKSGQAPNIVQNNTVYNSGGVAIYHPGPGPQHIVSNHVFSAGLYSGDVSALYLPAGMNAQGTVVDHNWIHTIHGLGTRCDVLGKEVIVRYNVIWNVNGGCKWEGEGPFYIYNNTYFVDNPTSGLMLAEVTPVNTRGLSIRGPNFVKDTWTVANNVTHYLRYRYPAWYARQQRKKNPEFEMYIKFNYEENDHFGANVEMGEDGDPAKYFVSTDIENIDLRPKSGSPLIDAGISVKGNPYAISKPDVGAYEYGGDYWVPGADWMPDGSTPPRSMKEATLLAWKKLGRKQVYTPDMTYGHK